MIVRRPFLLLAALLLGSGSALALVSRSFEKRFTMPEKEIALLRVSVFHGSILVEPSDGKEITVKVREDYEAVDDAQADAIAKNLSKKIELNGREVFVGAEYSRNIHWTFENWPPVKLAFTISVPKHCNLDLYTRDGSLTVGRLAGDMKARTNWGTIFFRGVEGSVQANSEFGDIIISRCSGNVKLRSVSGNFHVGPVNGFADVFGYGGEIEVQSAGGGVQAETSGADLSVGFQHPIVAPAVLKTGGANVIITANRKSSCVFDLKASIFGKVVNVDDVLPLKPLSGALGRSRVVAQLNEGGVKIEAKASGGYVYLQATPEN